MAARLGWRRAARMAVCGSDGGTGSAHVEGGAHGGGVAQAAACGEGVRQVVRAQVCKTMHMGRECGLHLVGLVLLIRRPCKKAQLERQSQIAQVV